MKTLSIRNIIAACAAFTLVAALALGGCAGATGSSSHDGEAQGQATAQATDADGNAASGEASGGSSTSGGTASAADGAAGTGVAAGTTVVQNGTYTSKDEVALYVHEYGHLPSNFISKTKARKAGWDSSEGNLQDVCPGKSIGGSKFYNEDGQLPDANGRTWTECDIDYEGGYRGAKRIIFSNDGLIYYTDDHYRSFTRIF